MKQGLPPLIFLSAPLPAPAPPSIHQEDLETQVSWRADIVASSIFAIARITTGTNLSSLLGYIPRKRLPLVVSTLQKKWRAEK